MSLKLMISDREAKETNRNMLSPRVEEGSFVWMTPDGQELEDPD